MSKDERVPVLASENKCLFCDKFFGCWDVTPPRKCRRFIMDDGMRPYFYFGRGQTEAVIIKNKRR